MRVNRLVAGALLVACIGTVACDRESTEEATVHDPATVEPIVGGLNLITLEESAVERLGIETTPVRAAAGAEGADKVVPWGAVHIMPNGDMYAYKTKGEHTFVRTPIEVVRWEGRRVLLSEGPPVGTPVVTVGIPELWGLETGVGH